MASGRQSSAIFSIHRMRWRLAVGTWVLICVEAIVSIRCARPQMAGPVLDKTTQMFVDWQPIEVRFGLVRDGHIDCMPAARSKRHLETLGTRLNACLVQRDVKTGRRLLEDHFRPGVVLDPQDPEGSFRLLALGQWVDLGFRDI